MWGIVQTQRLAPVHMVHRSHWPLAVGWEVVGIPTNGGRQGPQTLGPWDPGTVLNG